MALFSKFFGRTVSDAAGFALGGAMRSPLEPPLQELTNATWKEFVAAGITVPTEPNDAAEIAAEFPNDTGWALDQAAQRGYGGDQMQKLIQAALTAPATTELLRMLRRGTIKPADLTHGFRKARLETTWDTPLAELQNERLDPAVIANAIVRGIMAAPFPLPVPPPSVEGNVKAFPTSPLDAEQEAAASGINLERLFVETAIAGRPMAPEEAAKSTFRNILQRPDFDRAISEGDVRNEWADAIFEYTREILTAHDHVELRLRGWYTSDDQMYAGTALHGMSQEDTDRLFKVLGRPMAHHQVFLAERRGGVYGETPADIAPAFLKSLQESNERPEWYGLEWAYRFAQPSVFVVRQYLKDGGDPAWAQKKLYYEGWEQSDIDIFIAEYTKAAKATANPVLKSQHTAAITAARKAYLAGNLANTVASEQLQALGETADDAARILAVWDIMYEIEAGTPPGSGGPH